MALWKAKLSQTMRWMLSKCYGISQKVLHTLLKTSLLSMCSVVERWKKQGATDSCSGGLMLESPETWTFESWSDARASSLPQCLPCWIQDSETLLINSAFLSCKDTLKVQQIAVTLWRKMIVRSKQNNSPRCWRARIRSISAFWWSISFKRRQREAKISRVTEKMRVKRILALARRKRWKHVSW